MSLIKEEHDAIIRTMLGEGAPSVRQAFCKYLMGVIPKLRAEAACFLPARRGISRAAYPHKNKTDVIPNTDEARVRNLFLFEIFSASSAAFLRELRGSNVQILRAPANRSQILPELLLVSRIEERNQEECGAHSQQRNDLPGQRQAPDIEQADF